jgi:hypothetical protein
MVPGYKMVLSAINERGRNAMPAFLTGGEAAAAAVLIVVAVVVVILWRSR